MLLFFLFALSKSLRTVLFRCHWHMAQLVTATVLNQQVPTDQIRQTGAVLEASVPGHWAAWLKFGACEEISHLLKRSAVLQRETHQAGNDVVETDQF